MVNPNGSIDPRSMPPGLAGNRLGDPQAYGQAGFGPSLFGAGPVPLTVDPRAQIMSFLQMLMAPPSSQGAPDSLAYYQPQFQVPGFGGQRSPNNMAADMQGYQADQLGFLNDAMYGRGISTMPQLPWYMQQGSQGAYGQGAYGQGTYGQGAYGQGNFGEGNFGVGNYGQGNFGEGSYGAGDYGAGNFGAVIDTSSLLASLGE